MDLGDIELEEADLRFLEACDDCAANELEILTWVEGREVEEGAAMKAHADSMVRRGYFERVSIGGSKSRMQGSKMRCVYRRTEAGEALLAAVRRIRELEAKREEVGGARARSRRTSPASPAHSQRS